MYRVESKPHATGLERIAGARNGRVRLRIHLPWTIPAFNLQGSGGNAAQRGTTRLSRAWHIGCSAQVGKRMVDARSIAKRNAERR